MSSDEQSVYPGVHDVDTTPINLGGDSDTVVEFEADMRAVFKRLADDIYDSPAAGLREALTNAVTAILRAVNRGDLEDEEGVIEVDVHDEADATRLVIRDNGIGVDEQTLRQAMAVIGRSAVRDDGEITGQFGMGFLALFKLVGTDGGFVMHTNPRDPDEDSYSGVWKASGFHIDEDGALDGLSDDEYGTEFELYLEDRIDIDELHTFVGHYSELARVPVIYSEYDANGRQVDNEDYGGRALADAYPDDAGLVVYEDEYVTAVCASEGDDRTLLLDVPIDRNASVSTGAPWWTYGVRLKREDSPVVEGPHEGLRVVSDAEYSTMSAERRADAVPESEVTDDDIVMPGPIGNREKLESNESFWEWLAHRVERDALTVTRDILDSLSTPEDARTLPSPEMKLLLKMTPTGGGGGASRYDIKSWVSREQAFSEVTVSDDVCRAIANLQSTVYREDNVSDVTNSNGTVDKQPLGVVYADARVNGGTVYTYGSTASTWRKRAQARVVFEADESNVIARLRQFDRDERDNLRETIGGKRLTAITPATVFNYDVDRDTALQFARTVAERDYETVLERRASNQTYSPHSVEGKDVTLHFGRKRDEKLTVQVGEVRDFCQRAGSADECVEFRGHTFRDDEEPKADDIVVFPSTSERNVSDYYDLGGRYTAVFKCTKTAWNEVLADVASVTHIDDYLAVDDDTRLVTDEGVVPAAELRERDAVLYHVVHDRLVDWFQKPANAKRVKQVLKAEPWGRRSEGVASDFPNLSKNRKRQLTSFECPDEFTYVPITAEQYEEGEGWIDSHPVIHGSKAKCFTHGTPMDGVNCLTLRLYASVPGAVERGEWPSEVSRLESRLARHGRNYRPSNADIELVDFFTSQLTAEYVTKQLDAE